MASEIPREVPHTPQQKEQRQDGKIFEKQSQRSMKMKNRNN